MTDYFEILGIDKDASKKEIKEAYYRLAMKFHPDHLEPEERKIYLPKFLRITRAYITLINDERKEEYLRQKALGTFIEEHEKERKENREKLFQRGLDVLHSKPHLSVKYFKMAYSLERTNQTYKSYYGLSLILTGRDAQGLKLCRGAIEKDENATHHYNLAYGYTKTKKFRKAINHLKKTLRLDSEHKEAKKLLNKLKEKTGFKGFFSRG